MESPLNGVMAFMIRECSRKVPVVFFACALASCASKSKLEANSSKPNGDVTSYLSNGTVKAEIVPAPDEARYPLTPGVSYVNPEPAAPLAIPIYPPFLLDKRLDPVVVVARVVVGVTGMVETATVIRNSSGEQAFSESTLATLKTWTFSPLKRIEGQLAESLPFTQEYRFTFKQVNGRAVVLSGTSDRETK